MAAARAASATTAAPRATRRVLAARSAAARPIARRAARTRAIATDAPATAADEADDDDDDDDDDEIAHWLRCPTSLYDPEFVGAERELDAKLASCAAAIKTWASDIERGVATTVTRDATDAAEWMRQALTRQIDDGAKNLSATQSKILASDPETIQNLLLMTDLRSVHATYALQALCYRNGAICGKAATHGAIDAARKHFDDDDCPEVVKCACAFLIGAIAAFNEDTHRLIAKGRLVPSIVNRLRRSCDGVECVLNARDFREKDFCDHATALLRNLSHNSAQHTLLKSAGSVEVLLNLVSQRRGAVRINSACAIANLVGREESDDRLTKDATIIEETVDVLGAFYTLVPIRPRSRGER